MSAARSPSPVRRLAPPPPADSAALRGTPRGAGQPPPNALFARRSGPGRIDSFRRGRRIAAIAAAIALVPALVSLGRAVVQPSNSSLGILAVEWLRDNGARGIVQRVENLWYSWNAPSMGGPGLKSLPSQPGVALSGTGPSAAAPAGHGRSRQPSGHAVAAGYRPPDIVPVITPALSGEGVWRATWAHGGTHPPVLVTSFRPSRDYPRVVAGVAWIDRTQTRVRLYPGIKEPAVTMANRGPEEIPDALRSRVVAAFNSGFKLSDSKGGFAYGGRTYRPLVNGLATFVRRRTGYANVVAWRAGPTAPADVIYARQNLPLIVEWGHPNPNLNDGPQWGYTLGNKVLVWRSGVGVDARGNLIYAAANDLTVGMLADILVRAGAVRAMELDINSYWPSFITYRAPGATGAADLLTSMTRSSQRYLTPDDRDFFGVFVK